MKNLFIGTVLSLALFSGCDNGPQPVTAYAEIVSYDFGYGTPLIGNFIATYQDGVVTATIYLEGQEDRPVRALHLHDGTCETPGNHWNMGHDQQACDLTDMNGVWDKMYRGDMGNLIVTEDGTGSFTLQTDLWSIGTNDSTDIVGKLIIVHFFPTDFSGECDPSHMPDHTHTNPKLGCGTINLN